MARFLVTGGCGFIGSHLCEALVACSHEVRVLDDLSSGRRSNLASGATLIRASADDADRVAAGLEGVDGCFHLAAIASVERGRREWVRTHRANATGLVTILEAIARRRRPLPVVYASSAAVYGDCADLPIAETAERVPLSAYGADKYACEMHAKVGTHVHGIPTTGLRFFNVYGSRQDPTSPYSGVISIFADRLARGEPVDIYGDGQQTRDFICVDDVISALLQAMTRRLPGAPVFNVCTGVSCSVLDLARSVGRLCGVRPEIRLHRARPGDIRNSVGDPSLASAALGLAAPIPLASGLRTMRVWGGSPQRGSGQSPDLHAARTLSLARTSASQGG